MTSELLHINESVIVDDSIESFQFVEQLSEAGEANINTPGTKINITFNNSSHFIHPYESYLRIEGNLTTAAGVAWTAANESAIAFVNNGILNLFIIFKYELADTIIEYSENAGFTTTVHNYSTKSRTYQGLDWIWKPDEGVITAEATNTPFLIRNLLISPPPFNFSVCIPLKVIFNFCNDYNKVMWGLKHIIRMTRSNSTRALFRSVADISAVVNGIYHVTTAVGNEAVVNLTTLRWYMPVVRPSPSHEQALLEIVGSNSKFIDVAFLNKRTNSIAVPAATTFTWPLATTCGVERPRYIVILFQGAVANQATNSSVYSSAPNVTNAYITLYGIKYPSIDMNTYLANNKYSKWYREYKNFFNNYNSNDISQPCLSYIDFIKVASMYIFKCISAK